jgi:hypothetical protein
VPLANAKWLIRQVDGKIEEVTPKSEGGEAMALHLRPLTEKEAQAIKKWSQSRTEAAPGRVCEDHPADQSRAQGAPDRSSARHG